MMGRYHNSNNASVDDESIVSDIRTIQNGEDPSTSMLNHQYPNDSPSLATADDICTVEGTVTGSAMQGSNGNSGNNYERHMSALGQPQYGPEHVSTGDNSRPNATLGSSRSATMDTTSGGGSSSNHTGSFLERVQASFRGPMAAATAAVASARGMHESDDDIAKLDTAPTDPEDPAPVFCLPGDAPPATIVVADPPLKNGSNSSSQRSRGGTGKKGAAPANSIWKQRLCGLRADRLIILLMFILLLAVGVIVAALVLSRNGRSSGSSASSSSSSSVTSNGSGNDASIDRNGFLDGEDIVSLTRTPTAFGNTVTSPAPAAAAVPTSSTTVAPSAMVDTDLTDFPTMAGDGTDDNDDNSNPGEGAGTDTGTDVGADTTVAPSTADGTAPAIAPLETTTAPVVAGDGDGSTVVPDGTTNNSTTDGATVAPGSTTNTTTARPSGTDGLTPQTTSPTSVDVTADLPSMSPVVPWPTNCPADDGDETLFAVHALGETPAYQNCTWLGLPENEDAKDRLCQVGQPGRFFCRATCRSCARARTVWPTALCGTDSTTGTFPTTGFFSQGCDWLEAFTLPEQTSYCQPDFKAFDMCRETCFNCGPVVSQAPAVFVSDAPTVAPTMVPTGAPTLGPSRSPVVSTAAPTILTTDGPTTTASRGATGVPTVGATTMVPTEAETEEPTAGPTEEETDEPTIGPTAELTEEPEDDQNEEANAEFLQGILASVSSSVIERIENSGTPQQQAYEWLLESMNEGVYDNDTDEDRLVQLFALRTLGYSTEIERSWAGDEDECSWDGITCNDDSEVTEINLEGKGLDGSLPPDVSLLENLESFVVSDNRLGGTFPRSFGNLKNLEVLKMDRNEFTGTLPDAVGGMRNLRVWWFERNIELTGQFPGEVSRLQNLEELIFYYTDLSGDMPNEVCEIGLDVLILDCRQMESDCWTRCFYRCGGDSGIEC